MKRILLLTLALGLASGCGFLKRNAPGGLSDQIEDVKDTGVKDTVKDSANTVTSDVKDAATDVKDSAADVAGDISDLPSDLQGPIKEALDEVNNWKDKDEDSFGSGLAMRLVLDNGGLHEDWRLTGYLNDVANALGVHSGRAENPGGRGASRRFVVGVLNTDELNAFSTPGGYIFVTQGLLKTISTEAELAFVLAHEIAHIDKEHMLQVVKIQMATAGGAKALVDAIGGEAAGNLLDKPRVYDQFADIVVKAVTNVGLLKKNEFEADSHAVELMNKAGYDSRASGRVLKAIAGAAEDRKQTLARTHPSVDERKAKLAGKTKAGSVHFGRYDSYVRTQLPAGTKKAEAPQE